MYIYLYHKIVDNRIGRYDMALKNILIIVTAILLASCGGAKHNSAGTNTIQGISDKKLITFNDILPLLEQKCSLCHRRGGNVFNVLDYETALSKIAEINNRVVVVKDMPEIGTMTDEERDIIARWVEDGGLEGNINEEPPTPEEPPMPEDPPGPQLISFSEVIRPLFKMKCALCHNENSGLLNVLDYSAIITRLDALNNRVVVRKDMPQVGTMTDEERNLVEEWILQGAEE